MPTSSGFDRTNYGTTLNFSRYAQQNQQNGGPNYNYHHYPPQAKASQNNPQTRSNPNLSFNTSNENSSNSLQHSNQQKFFTPTTTTQRTGQSYKQHFTAAKQMKAASVGASPNPENSSNGTVENPYNVTIRDPNLRELVQKLVKTNDFNAKKNVMHKGNPDEGTTITKIDHNGYRILFSKNARYPIEEILQQQGFMARTQVPKEHRTTQTETNLKKTREKQREVASYQARTPSPQPVQMVHEAPHTPPTFYDGQSNYEEPPANRYASTGSPASSSGRSKSETRTMIINESTPINAASLEGVPPEVQKIIEQDLTKNPMASGAERMYRVVINRNLTAANSPDEDPAHVLRVIVKNEGGQNIGHAVSPQQLPQQQPTTTYVQTMTTPQPTTVIQAVPQQQLFNRQKSIVLHYPPPQMTQAPPPTAVAPQPQQVHYILPPIEPIQQQPHRYTPPPHKSVILPSANASSRMSSHAAAEEETAKKPKKRFSFFS